MSDRTNLLHLYNFMSTYIEQRSKHQPEETSPENEGEESRSMGQQQTIEEKVWYINTVLFVTVLYLRNMTSRPWLLCVHTGNFIKDSVYFGHKIQRFNIDNIDNIGAGRGEQYWYGMGMEKLLALLLCSNLAVTICNWYINKQKKILLLSKCLLLILTELWLVLC